MLIVLGVGMDILMNVLLQTLRVSCWYRIKDMLVIGLYSDWA